MQISNTGGRAGAADQVFPGAEPPTSASASARAAATTALSGAAGARAPGGPATLLAAVPVPAGLLPAPGRFAAAERGYAAATVAPGPSPAAASRPKPGSSSTSGSGKASSSKGASTKTSSSKSATTKTSSSKASSVSAASSAAAFTSKELAFLKDQKLSVEEKLFRFMALLIEKNDQQLVAAMNEYAGKTAPAARATGGGASSRAGGGAGTPAGGAKAGTGGEATAKKLASEVGGPLLAAAVSAVGFPELAPVALSVGGAVGSALVDVGSAIVDVGADAVGGAVSFLGDLFGGGGDAPRPRAPGEPAHQAVLPAAAVADAPPGPAPAAKEGKPAPAPAATAATTAGASEVDEKLEMLKLQRLVEKQNAMFSALSNVLKSIHDSQMTAVQNIR
jgi:hypothetical protein